VEREEGNGVETRVGLLYLGCHWAHWTVWVITPWTPLNISPIQILIAYFHNMHFALSSTVVIIFVTI
jgi:hypothetical protein